MGITGARNLMMPIPNLIPFDRLKSGDIFRFQHGQCVYRLDRSTAPPTVTEVTTQQAYWFQPLGTVAVERIASAWPQTTRQPLVNRSRKSSQG